MVIIKNDYIVKGEVTEVFLQSRTYPGLSTLIDTDDLQLIKDIDRYWHPRFDKTTKSFYVFANKGSGEGRTSVHLHRLIMNVNERYLYVDHIFHNTLDNRKKHLRIVTNSENQQNARNKDDVGVFFHKRDKLWGARIKVNRKEISLGYFKRKEDAIKARRRGEEKYFQYKNSLPKI